MPGGDPRSDGLAADRGCYKTGPGLAATAQTQRVAPRRPPAQRRPPREGVGAARPLLRGIVALLWQLPVWQQVFFDANKRASEREKERER